MLNHVRAHDRVDAAGQPFELLEIGDDDLIEPLFEIDDAVDLILESERAVKVTAHRLAELPSGRAQVEQFPAALRVTADQPHEDSMAAAFEIFECIDVRQ